MKVTDLEKGLSRMDRLRSKYLFVSHAREDRELLEEIRMYADCLSDIEWWDDGSLLPGANWGRFISDTINSSYAALLLISQYSLRSEFVWRHEVPELLNSGIPVSWLKIRECPWDISSRAATIRAIQALRDPVAVPFSALNGAQREAELNIIVRHLSEFSLCSRRLQNGPAQPGSEVVNP
ncbi:MAG: toll/interleukin-1 receptor domain-containing protein, partial [Syntrophaceae bacterium]